MGDLALYVMGASALSGIVAGGALLVSLPLKASYDNYVKEMSAEYEDFDIVHNLDEGIDRLSDASKELTHYSYVYNVHHSPDHEDALEYLDKSQQHFIDAGTGVDLDWLAQENSGLIEELEALPSGENEEFYEPTRLNIDALAEDAENVRETYFMYVPLETIEGRESKRNAYQAAQSVAKTAGIIAGSVFMWYGQVWWWLDND